MVALHGNRLENLMQTVAAWVAQSPLQPLEQEVMLVQSNGMAEWVKMELAQALGVSAAVKVELPGRFVWEIYRTVLGREQVPRHTPLDKPSMLWHLMALLPEVLAGEEKGGEAGGEESIWQGLRAAMLAMLQADAARADDSQARPPMRHATQTSEETVAAGQAAGADAQRQILQTHRYFLAQRLADLFDQYQVYRPDWLMAWEQGSNTIDRLHHQACHAPGEENGQAQPGGHGLHGIALPPQQAWQPHLWRKLLARLPADERECVRPRLHQRTLQALAAMPAHQRPALPRRIHLFGMTHVPLPVLELLAALAPGSQVLLAVPNPCRFYWSDAVDGRELFRRHARSQRHASRHGVALAQVPLEEMHAHANPLLVAWGRQVRDYVRQLEAFDEAEHGRQRLGLPRIDCFEEETPAHASLLQQVQNQIRDLEPLPLEPAALAAPAAGQSVPHHRQLPNNARADAAKEGRTLADEDHSIVFRVAHSPMREVEALHDHLLDHFQHSQAGSGLQPRDVVVMTPDIAQYAALIQAVFGQYARDDARYIPFEIADLGAQAASPLVNAVDWLTRLPQQRAGLSELAALLGVPAVAARFGLDEEGVATLCAWMQGSGIRWGVSAPHRAGLGLPQAGAQNTGEFGLQRMLLGYASGQQSFGDLQPYDEVGGLAAAHVGALAQLQRHLACWLDVLATPATPAGWAQRWRALLADFVQPASEEDRAALAMLEDALQAWQRAASHAGFEQPVPLAVARNAWLGSLQTPTPAQRFHAGGVTFCTLMPMRAIPFKLVCLLGMNDGDYPRQSQRSDMDLMALPHLARPGDRSRAQDDRQLMLEALLSAREQLYISWAGRNVRDNTERAPSVLVAQLRDYLRALHGEEALEKRTLEHPLQPFSRKYFEGALPQTWAREWRAVHEPAATAGEANAADAQPMPAPTASRPATPAPKVQIWSVAELAQVWKSPVKTWFAKRLHVRFETLPEMAPDLEPFDVDSLQRWSLWNGLLRQLAPAVEQGASVDEVLQQADAALANLQKAGVFPLHEAGQRLRRQWQEEMAPMLAAWVDAVSQWPHTVPAQRIALTLELGECVCNVQDWTHPARAPSIAGSADASQWLWLEVTPTRLTDKGSGKKRSKDKASKEAPADQSARATPVRLSKITSYWVRSVVTACTAAQQHASAPQQRIITPHAVLDIAPIAAQQAAQWLALIVQTACQAVQQPLPLDVDAGFAWLQHGGNAQEGKDSRAPETASELPQAKALTEARKAYEQAQHPDASTRRLYQTFDDLLATGRFEQLALQLLGPVQQWAQTHVRIRPLSRDDEDSGADD